MKFQQPLIEIHQFKNTSKIAFLLLTLISWSVTAQAQPQQGGKTAVGKILDKTASTNNSRSDNKKRTTDQKGSQGGTRGSKGTGQPKDTKGKVEQRQQVVFKTGAPLVEILLDGSSIGASDSNAKLTVVIPSGEHQVNARKYNEQLFEPIKISVNAKQNSFDLSASVAQGIDKLRQAQNSALTEKVEPPKVEPKRVVVDPAAILEAYIDPQRTDSVKVTEWQAINEFCFERRLNGNTENNIEGLCAFTQGQIELAAGNAVKAINLFSAAAVFLPNEAFIHYGLGNAHFVAGRAADAINAYTKTTSLDKDFALAYKKTGDIYFAQGRNKEAATKYQVARNLGMTSPELRLRIAEIQIRNKQCSLALKDLETLKTEVPSANVYIALSDCYLDQKRAHSAIEALDNAIKLDPSSPIAYYKVGTIYLDQKEFEKAKEALESALKFDLDGKVLNRKELQKLIEKAQKRSR